MIILYISLFLFAAYSILIIYYWLCWRSVPVYIAKQKPGSTKVSLIIPARNEAANIGKLLKALQAQTYPSNLVETIVINDHSEDDTMEIVKGFENVISSDLEAEKINSYKKKAIEKGIRLSSGSLVITTDADCIPPPTWIETLVSFYEEKKPAFIAAPVIFQNDSSLVQIFQALDFLVLQGITAASVHKKIHSMCNGANLAYSKEAFEQVKGFDGVDDIASGDDMLLMHKIWKKYPSGVHYLRSRQATIVTQPMKTWREFFNQRIRWASKAMIYDDKKIFWALLLVYLFNLSFLAMFAAGFWSHRLWLYLLALWVTKTILELPFVFSVSRYFGQQFLVPYFFFFQPLHIAYTIIAGWLGQFKKYDWKGRKVK